MRVRKTRCLFGDDGLRNQKVSLARRLGWHMPHVDRLFDLRHAPTLEQIEAAAIVLGRPIEVRVAA